MVPELVMYRCASRHAFFHDHPRCPRCGNELTAFAASPEATLVAQTMVRVSPSGTPFRLGIAAAQSGAKTLCLIADAVPDGENVPVLLGIKSGLFRARQAKREG
jgi:uncharacterized OB-fold protein